MMQVRTEAEITQSMLAFFVATTDISDVRELGITSQTFSAVGQQLDLAQQATVEVRNSFYWNAAADADLDDRMLELQPDGLPRVKALFGLGGGVVFTRPTVLPLTWPLSPN